MTSCWYMVHRQTVDSGTESNRRYHDLDRKITQGAIECFLAYRLAGYLGKRNAHTENLRVGLVYNKFGKLVDIKVQLAGDFEDFVKEPHSKGLKGLWDAYGNMVDAYFNYAILFMSGIGYEGLYDSELSPVEITQMYVDTAKAMSFVPDMSLKDRLVNVVKISVGAGAVFSAVSSMQSSRGITNFSNSETRLVRKISNHFERKDNARALILANRAMNGQKHTEGGIDLNTSQMSMQVKKDGQDFKFDFNGTEVDAAQVTGATFTIRTMTPVTNLPEVLGLNIEPANKLKEELLVKA